MEFNKKLTLLSSEEVGIISVDAPGGYRKIKYKLGITDLAILTGAKSDFAYAYYHRYYPYQYGGWENQGFFWTKTSDGAGRVVFTDCNSRRLDISSVSARDCAIVLAFRSLDLFPIITKNKKTNYDGLDIVTFGEYPKHIANVFMQNKLEKEYQSGRLRKTGGTYTFDSTPYDEYNQKFQPITYEEYECDSEKYVRIKANLCRSFVYLNGIDYHNGNNVWLKVCPVIWLIDDRTKSLVLQDGILAGIRFDSRYYNGNFSTTEMKKYIDKYMMKDLFQRTILFENSIKQLEERNQCDEQKILTKKIR